MEVQETHLTPNFTLAELTHSETADRLGIDNQPDPVQLANLTRLANLLEQVRALVRSPNQPPTAIVVLGAGRHRLAAEYGASNLTQQAMVRLRYGVWLARQTGLPLGYAGGVGWAQIGEQSEAETAARIVQDEHGTSLRWTESRSRDTRENADLMVPILDGAGVKRIVLVTHASHMPRAMRAFREAAGKRLVIIPAPVAAVTRDDQSVLDWMPSHQGFTLVHNALHEVLGLLTGS